LSDLHLPPDALLSVIDLSSHTITASNLFVRLLISSNSLRYPPLPTSKPPTPYLTTTADFAANWFFVIIGFASLCSYILRTTLAHIFRFIFPPLLRTFFSLRRPLPNLAHSRPPPVRTSSIDPSQPPLSPSERPGKNASASTTSLRRKSIQVAPDRKASRPAPLTRRSTPQITKLGAGHGHAGRSSKEKEKEDDHEDRGLVGESFPQFWYVVVGLFGAVRLTNTTCDSTYCEKQINSTSTNFLYCSESYVLMAIAAWLLWVVTHAKQITGVDSTISRPLLIRIANVYPQRLRPPRVPLSPPQHTATRPPSFRLTDLTLYLAPPPLFRAPAPISTVNLILPLPIRSPYQPPNPYHTRAFPSAKQPPAQPLHQVPLLLASVSSPLPF
jgi:hypothetical protein